MTIKIHITDPFARARKAFKMMGFVNDRLGLTGTLAEIFMAYRDLDSSDFAPKPGGDNG